MSDILIPADRPGEWTTLGDHDRRIRALEAVPPCCDQSSNPCISFAARMAEAAAVSTDRLLAWWTLGEASGDFADISGQTQPADGTVTTVTTALTRDVTGCLGSEQDDGAVRFNDNDGTGSDYITTASGGDGDRFNLTNDEMTIAAWLNPTASGSTFTGNVVGQTNGGLRGWRMWVAWPLREVNFFRGNDGGGATFTLEGPVLPDGECTFVVATYSPVDGFAMYYDGVLVADDPTLINALPNVNNDPKIGRGGVGHADLETTFYGTVDDLSIWGDLLTTTEISSLFLAGQSCTDADEFEVLTADGSGGTYWDFATIEVEY